MEVDFKIKALRGHTGGRSLVGTLTRRPYSVTHPVYSKTTRRLQKTQDKLLRLLVLQLLGIRAVFTHVCLLFFIRRGWMFA